MMLTSRSKAMPDDAGVIAIVVALSISTFVLGFSALAVDLGSAYTRKAELQSIADRLALAGANGLPDIGHPQGALDLIRQTLTGLCADDRTPGLCPDDGSAPSLNWATDADPNNGRIDFYTDPDSDGEISPADRLTDLGLPAAALQVTLPPSTVQFGLAAAIGFSSVDVHKSASARIGTPLAGGILPFAVTEADVASGQFCVIDQNVGPALPHTTPLPTFYGFLPIQTVLTPDHADADTVSAGGVSINVKLQPQPGYTTRNYRKVNVYFSNADRTWFQDLTVNTTGTYTVPVPPGEATDRPQVWAHGEIEVWGTPRGGGSPRWIWRQFNSRPVTFTYDGIPDTTPDLCAQPPSRDRGYVDLARDDGASDPLATNTRLGPRVRLFPYSPVGAILGAATDPCVTQTFSPRTSCLTSVQPAVPGPPSLGGSLRNGLLKSSGNQPGRLIGTCADDGNSNDSNGVDRTRLLVDGSPLVDTTQGGSSSAPGDPPSGSPGNSGSALLFSVLHGRIPDQRGWIKSQALRCPRMAVVPVVGPSLLTLPGNQQPIVRFVYAWIDDPSTHRGVTVNSGSVYTVRGYLLDPKYLPAITSGSPQVGPYLGGDMPKEALLIHNLGGAAS